MTRSAFSFLLVSLLFLAATEAQAQWGFTFDDQADWTLTISGARLDEQAEGDFLWGDGGGTALDLEDVLDLGDSESFAGRIDFQPGGNGHFRLGVMPLEFNGDSVLAAAETVNGLVYGVGDRVSSDLEVRNYELAFGYKIRLGRRLMIAPVFQVNVLDGLLETVDLDLVGSGVEEDFLVPIALTGLRVEVYPLARLALFAEAKGFKASSWGELEEARVADGEIGLSFHLSRNVLLTGSYHLSDFRFDVSDTEIDLDLSGLRVSLDYRF